MNCGEDVYSDLGRYIAHLHEVVMQVCENNTIFKTITDPGVGQIASYYAVTKNPFLYNADSILYGIVYGPTIIHGN
jgi:hypothetical protein